MVNRRTASRGTLELVTFIQILNHNSFNSEGRNVHILVYNTVRYYLNYTEEGEGKKKEVTGQDWDVNLLRCSRLSFFDFWWLRKLQSPGV